MPLQQAGIQASQHELSPQRFLPLTHEVHLDAHHQHQHKSDAADPEDLGST